MSGGAEQICDRPTRRRLVWFHVYPSEKIPGSATHLIASPPGRWPAAATTKAGIIHWQPGSDHRLLHIYGPSRVSGLWDEHCQRVVDLSDHPINLVNDNQQVHQWLDTGADQVLFLKVDHINVIGAEG